jgi:hypothetical protein
LKQLKVYWGEILEDPTIAGLPVFYRQATDNLHALKATGESISSKALLESIVKLKRKKVKKDDRLIKPILKY